MDKNRDGSVSEYELRNWIRLQHRGRLQRAAEAKWTGVDSDADGQLTIGELLDASIGRPDTCNEGDGRRTGRSASWALLRGWDRDLV